MGPNDGPNDDNDFSERPIEDEDWPEDNSGQKED